MGGSHEPTSTGRPNSIGLSERNLKDLLDILDASTGKVGTRRTFARWPFRVRAVAVRIKQPGGTHSDLELAGRNLSAGGMSLLHCSFMFPGSKCTVSLPTPDGSIVTVDGTVARCSHIRGVLHEIGIKFDKNIRVRDYVMHDDFEECFSLEQIEPEQLTGHLLLVTPCEIDHRIIKHYLRETCLSVSIATTAGEALVAACNRCDVILIELCDDDFNGYKLVPELRSAGVLVPVILMSSDTSQRARALYRISQADSFLVKPLTDLSLMRGLAEYLVVSKDLEEQEDAGRAGATELADSFAHELGRQAGLIEQAIARGDCNRCLALVLKLQGTAPCLGFGAIGRAARAAVESMSSSGDLKQCTAVLADLITACQQAQKSEAA